MDRMVEICLEAEKVEEGTLVTSSLANFCAEMEMESEQSADTTRKIRKSICRMLREIGESYSMSTPTSSPPSKRNKSNGIGEVVREIEKRLRTNLSNESLRPATSTQNSLNESCPENSKRPTSPTSEVTHNDPLVSYFTFCSEICGEFSSLLWNSKLLYRTRRGYVRKMSL